MKHTLFVTFILSLLMLCAGLASCAVGESGTDSSGSGFTESAELPDTETTVLSQTETSSPVTSDHESRSASISETSVPVTATSAPVTSAPTTSALTLTSVITSGKPQTTAVTTVTTTSIVTTEPETLIPLFEADGISAPNWALYDVSSDRLLCSSTTDYDAKIYPAGAVKLLTALTALDHIGQEELIKIGSEQSLLKADAGRSGLEQGDILTRDQALKALLLSSGNDSAYALAALAGRKILKKSSASDKDAVSAFVKRMNAKAKEIGMKHSSFDCPDGYPGNGVYSCLRDLIALSLAAYKNETVTDICSEISVSETLVSGGECRWSTQNRLTDPANPLYYEYATGLTVGSSKNAGYCMITSAEKYGERLIALVFGSTSGKGGSEDTRRLFDLGFGLETASPDIRIVECEEFVSLRALPNVNSKRLMSIKRGETVRVIDFIDRFAYVEYVSGGKARLGYILAGYLKKEGVSYEDDLETVVPEYVYSYDRMCFDLKALEAKYPGLVSVSSIGKSEEGRDLMLATVGNPDAPDKILVHAAIHAREYMTTTFLMAQLDYILSHRDNEFGASGRSIGEILSSVCFYVIPMLNPDGVNIVQTGVLPEEFKNLDPALAKEWKANAKGVDLNANFDAHWEDYSDKYTKPGPYGYKGKYPEEAAEVKALVSFVKEHDISLTLSYHTTGSVIYWKHGDDLKLNYLNKDLALRLYGVSGLGLEVQNNNSTAGFKDWMLEKRNTVSLTIEIGTADNPIALREFDGIWNRCRDFLLIAADWQLGR